MAAIIAVESVGLASVAARTVRWWLREGTGRMTRRLFWRNDAPRGTFEAMDTEPDIAAAPGWLIEALAESKADIAAGRLVAAAYVVRGLRDAADDLERRLAERAGQPADAAPRAWLDALAEGEADVAAGRLVDGGEVVERLRASAARVRARRAAARG